MTEPQPARLCILTDPEPGRVFVLAVQETEGADLKQWQISRDQLLELNHKTADILRRAFR